jgi:steroid delta-isomerase
MPSADEIRSTVTSYLEHLSHGDVEGIMQLYADGASVEDPVGGEAVVGTEAIRGFYTSAAGRVSAELTGLIRVAGKEAAFPMLATVDFGDRRVEMDVIDTMRFDDEGKILAMRAFWSPGDMRPAR